MHNRCLLILCLFLINVSGAATATVSENNSDAVSTDDLQTQLVAAVKRGKDKKFEQATKQFEALQAYWQFQPISSLYLTICGDIESVIEKKKAGDVFKGAYEDLTGNTKKGLKRVEKVSKKYKNYYPLYILQAEMLTNLDENDKAIQAYDRAIELAGDEILPHLFRGKYYAAIQEPDGAIYDYTQALDRDTTSAMVYFERGFTYCLKEKYTLAINDFEKAVTNYPEWGKSTIVNEAYHNRGLLHIQRKAYKEAIKDFDRAIEINPDFLKSYLSRGIAYRNLKSYTKAMADFNHCIPGNPIETSAVKTNRITTTTY